MAGTGWFAGLHVVWFAGWIAWNTWLVASWRPVDPFPFSFLTLVVSLEAIFLTLFVLISQNNLTRQSERRAHLDLQVNLLAEQESTKTVALGCTRRKRGDITVCQRRPTSTRATITVTRPPSRKPPTFAWHCGAA
jgi:uncharacterized membrane protein